MTAYVPSVPNFSEPSLRRGVIICPGGGFVGFNEREMETVALQFAASGCCAFVLNYSIGAGTALLPAPLLDLAKAIATVRQRSRQWGIDSHQIILCGFSSSAYMTALYGSVWHEPWLSDLTRLESEQIKPNGVILGYPIVDLAEFETRVKEEMPDYEVLVEMMLTALFNTPHPSEEQLETWGVMNKVSEQSAPTLLWIFKEDALVSIDVLKAYQSELLKNNVPCESAEFSGDVHGSGLNFGNDLLIRAQWFTKMLLP